MHTYQQTLEKFMYAHKTYFAMFRVLDELSLNEEQMAERITVEVLNSTEQLSFHYNSIVTTRFSSKINMKAPSFKIFFLLSSILLLLLYIYSFIFTIVFSEKISTAWKTL